MKRRKTLASLSQQLSELIVTMGSAPLYFSSEYDGDDGVDVVSEKMNEIVSSHNKILGYFRIKCDDKGTQRLGVVVYPSVEVQRKDEIKGVNYDRMCF